MSWVLAVWEGPRPTSDADAQQTCDALHRRWLPRFTAGSMQELLDRQRPPPTPAIAEYVTTLLERWPDLGEPGSELSPWSDGPLIDNAAGPIIYFAFAHGRAQGTVPIAAQLAVDRGLVCYDPQTGSLRDRSTSVVAIVHAEGRRVTQPVLDSTDLAAFTSQLTDQLAPLGFEPWNDGVVERWRLTGAGVGAGLRIDWQLVGHRGTGARFGGFVDVVHERLEQCLRTCPVIRRRYSGAVQWTFTEALEQLGRAPLPASVEGPDELPDLMNHVLAAARALPDVLDGCADLDGLRGHLDEQGNAERRALALALSGDTPAATRHIEQRALQHQRDRQVERALAMMRFADWLEHDLPLLVAALPEVPVVNWDAPRPPFRPAEPPLSRSRQQQLDAVDPGREDP